MKKYLLLILLTLSLLLVGCVSSDPIKSTPSDGLLTNELTVGEMKKDLKLYSKYVKEKHADFDHQISEDEFDEEIKAIRNNLDDMTSDEFVFAIMKLHSKLGDGNSFTILDDARLVNRKYLPFDVKKFAEGYIITKIEETHKDYLGYELKAIDSTSFEDVIAKLSQYVEGDTVEAKKYNALSLANFYDVLYNAGIVSSKYAQLTLAKGEEEVKVSVEFYNNKDYSKVKFAESAAALYSEKKDDYYSYSLVDKAVYIQVNYCYNMTNKSIKDLAQELKDFLKINIHKYAVLDLRYNIGGVQDAIFPIISVLKDFAKEGGNVTVLIGKGTKGIGIINAMYIANNEIGTLIGENTGGVTNFYGIRSSMVLPKSQLTIVVPTKFQEYFVNQTPITLKPSYTIEQSYEDYVQGIDSLVKYATK